MLNRDVKAGERSCRVEQIGIGEPDWEFPIQAYWCTKRLFLSEAVRLDEIVTTLKQTNSIFRLL